MAAVLFSLRDCHFIDSDGDGLPDYLETYNGLIPHDPSDGEGVNRADLTDPKNTQATQIPDSGTDKENEENNENEEEIPDEKYVEPDSENDLCPLVPEDFDGVDDEDGCPEISENSGGENSGGENTGGENSGGENSGEENSGGENSGGKNSGENSGGENSGKTEESITVIPGDSSICGFIDYRAQIRKGDTIRAAILKDDDSVIFSESSTKNIQ